MNQNLFLLLIFITLFTSVTANASTKKNITGVDEKFIDEVRFLYFLSMENEEKLEELEKLLKSKYKLDEKTNPPIVLAYFGAVEALKAKHAFWPLTKTDHLNTSMDIYKKALKKDPDNLEIRFMRYSILIEVPGIIGWGDEEEADKKMIMQLLSKKEKTGVDQAVKKVIAEFMIENGDLSEKEISSLKEIYMAKKKLPPQKKLLK